MGQTLANAERRHILMILDISGGNRTRAARVLGISVRCLRNKLREYRDAGLHVPLSSGGGRHGYTGASAYPM